MLKFILILVALFFFWRNNSKQKNSYMCSSSILLGIYLVSAFFCIPTLFIGDYQDPFTTKYWWPSLLFLFSLLLLLMPARNFRDNDIIQLVLPNRSTLNVIATVLIVLSLFSIINYAGTVTNIFNMDLKEARTDLVLGTEYVEAGLLNTIASVSASLYVYVLLLFFIFCTIPSPKALRILLLISSLSEPLHILAYVGRDGVVFWFFSFIFLYAIFRPYMIPSSQKFLRKTFIYAGSILLVPFLLITVSRFGSARSGGFDSIINYWGQGFIQGTLFMGIEAPPYTHGSIFPLFFEITGISRPSSSGMIQIGEWHSWYFSTLVVDLIRSLGYVGFFVLAIFLYFVFVSIMKIKSGKLYFYQLFYYILYFQIMSQGVFYFKQYTRGGNLFILLTLLLVLFFKLTFNPQNPIRIYKKI